VLDRARREIVGCPWLQPPVPDADQPAFDDLVEIGLPPHSDTAWPVSDWPQDLTFHTANPTLKDRYPDVYQLIKNIKLTNEQQAGMILDIDINGMSREAAVRKWMAANESVWKAWIPQ